MAGLYHLLSTEDIKWRKLPFKFSSFLENSVWVSVGSERLNVAVVLRCEVWTFDYLT